MPLPGCHNSGNYLNCASIAIMENTLFGLFFPSSFFFFFFSYSISQLSQGAVL